MDYRQTLEYLFGQLPMYQRIGQAAYKADLSTTLAFDKLLAEPHKSFKTIHLAGTNGKGSCSHMLASILQEAGYKTGLYTSPHLVDFRERIRVNGLMIPEKEVTSFVELYKEATEELKPSFFEWSVALAFSYFKKEQVDVAVIETGMGGRLDSTNIVQPILSIITNIGLDHQQFLGDNIAKIAREKAGIIKESTPVIIGRKQKETEAVFQGVADQKKAPLFYSNSAQTGAKSSLKGSYQRENESTVLKAIELLNKYQLLDISVDSVDRGLQNVIANTSLKGRWQKLSNQPKVICDVGHNIDGVLQIVAALKQESFDHLHIVWGMVGDKDIEEIIRMLPINASYYCCQAKIPRSLNSEVLTESMQNIGLKAKNFRTVVDAYKEAITNASEHDLVFIGGSTFVVADLLEAIDS